MSEATFSKALDDHPKLKGKQDRLPDKIQAKIIGSKLKSSKLKKHASARVINPSILGTRVR